MFVSIEYLFFILSEKQMSRISRRKTRRKRNYAKQIQFCFKTQKTKTKMGYDFQKL